MPRHAQTSTQQDHRTDQATTQPHAHATPIPPVAQAARSGSAPPVPLPLAKDTMRHDHAGFAPTSHADAPLHPLRSCSTSDPDDPSSEAMPRHAQTSTQQDHRTDEATTLAHATPTTPYPAPGPVRVSHTDFNKYFRMLKTLLSDGTGTTPIKFVVFFYTVILAEVV